MYIIDKKRIKIILSCIIVSILAFSMQSSYKGIKKEQEDILTIQTVSTPVSGKVVVIDAGHGTPDEGAESSGGTTEAEINLKIALKIQNLLEQSGCTVILTRSDENSIYDIGANTIREKKISDIKNRVEIGNEEQVDIFVSIHLNKISDERYWGWQCFFNSKNEESKALANKIQESLNSNMQKENKREIMKLDSVYIMKHIEVPITIVECGFLSNPEEEKQLLEDEYQNKLAWGIYLGINEYFML